MSLLFASDHAGLALKSFLLDYCKQNGVECLDLGPYTPDSVDYPDFADKMAEALSDAIAPRGVLICGTGIGISIAANRHRHVRAALCHDVTTAALSREHNDANVLVLGSRIIGEEVAKACLDAFLTTAFANGRHAKRVSKLG